MLRIVAVYQRRYRSGIVATLFGLMLIVNSLGILPQVTVEAAGPSQSDTCSMPYQSVALPLTELAGQTYNRMDGAGTGFEGGLYPEGSNQRPPANEASGVAIAQTVKPLDAQGNSDPSNGRIGLISLGMSNTGQEFGAFQKLLQRNPLVNPRLTAVNGGVGGRTADFWVDPSSDAWQELARRLARASITPEQVQVTWINLALTKGGDFPDKAKQLQNDEADIIRLLKVRFPNLKLVYLSSRARSYTYWRGLSPEPVAFETGFAVKWLIEQQIQGASELNFDPAKGDIRAPFLSWGPYFWVNGPEPRGDGFSWGPEDLTGDCTHPSLQGRAKIGSLLFDFFLNDTTTRPWFAYGEQGQSNPSPTASAISQPSPTVQPATAVSSPDTASATSQPSPTTSDTPAPASSPPDSPMGKPIAYGMIVALVVVVTGFIILRRRSGS